MEIEQKRILIGLFILCVYKYNIYRNIAQLNVIIILEILESCTSEPHLYLAPSQRVTLLEFREIV